jgi:hypothetical protein
LKLTTSPTITGCLNSTRFIATVTRNGNGPPNFAISRRAPIAPAESIWLKMTPPKIEPSGLVSRGIMTTRIAT